MFTNYINNALCAKWNNEHRFNVSDECLLLKHVVRNYFDWLAHYACQNVL